MSQVIVVTSGKGGVGKTTTSASIAVGLALKGYKVVVIDFDIGLRNLDLIMGCEKRIVYDFINVLQGEVNIEEALIADNMVENLYILASSQIRDKDDLTKDGVGKIINSLKKLEFDYIICDSPAGIEKGAQLALYYADEAIIVTNPEMSSVRDADRMLGILQGKTKRAEDGQAPIVERVILTKYNPLRVEAGEMLSVEYVLDLLHIPLLGVVPESAQVLSATNAGVPVILNTDTDISAAYSDIVERIAGDDCEQRFLTVPKKGFFKRMFGG